VSIILEALRKSERERQAGQVPGMAQVVLESGYRRSRGLPWILVSLVVINAGGVGYWLYQSHSTQGIDPQPQVALPNSPASAQARDVGVASTIPVPEVTPPPTAMAPSMTYEPSPRPAYPMPEHLLPPANVGSMREDEEDPVDAELEAEGEASIMDKRQIGRTRQGLPRLSELPDAIQQRVPSFKITMFAYSENPQERFIIVNMKKYSAGDVLPGGVLLIEIRAEDLVAEMDGQKFLIPRF
jgi:general secretion pathway protein B